MNRKKDEKRKAVDSSLDETKFEEIEKMIDTSVAIYKQDLPAGTAVDHNFQLPDSTVDLVKEKLSEKPKPDRKIIHPKFPIAIPKIKIKIRKKTDNKTKRKSRLTIGNNFIKSKEKKNRNILKKDVTTQRDKIKQIDFPTSTINSDTLLDEDVRKLLAIVDDLLGELPDETIKKFAESEDFSLYEKIMKKYNIK